LRTAFPTLGSLVVQTIDPAARVPLQVIDLGGLSVLERETEVTRVSTEQGRRPFDLEGAPPWRAALLRIEEHRHLLVVSLHHIISDAWSNGVFFRELSALYAAFCVGGSSPLAELPLQYVDFAKWQRDWLRGQVLKDHLAYWEKRLAGAPSGLELPTDRPRPLVQSYRGATLPLILSEPIVDALRTLRRQQSVTLLMTAMAAFQILMHRYTGEDDVVVSTGTADRNRIETEALIGCLINIVLFRTD